MADAIDITFEVNQIEMALSSAGSGADYFFELLDVNTPFSNALSSNTVTAVLSTTVITLSATTGIVIGSVISARGVNLSGVLVTNISGNNVTVSSTTQWGPVGTVTTNTVYVWTVPNQNTVSVYDRNSQQWVNSFAQFVSSFNNVGVGNRVLQNVLSTAINNIAVGNDSLKALTTGNNHLAIGNGAGSLMTTSTSNTIIGPYTGNAPNFDLRVTGSYGTPASFIMNIGAGTTNAAAATLTLTFGAAATTFFPASVVTASIPGGSSQTDVVTAVVTALTADTTIAANWVVTSALGAITLTQITPTVVGFPIAFTSTWSLAPATGLVVTSAAIEARSYSTNGNVIIADQAGNIRAVCTSNGQWGFNTTQPVANVHVEGYTRLAQGWEKVLIDNGTLSGTVVYGVGNGAITLYTANPTANWVWNFTGAIGATAIPFNTVAPVGHSMTVSLITTQGPTAYYCTGIQIDGVAPTSFRWQGTLAPSSGNINGFDVYSFTIIKTAPATYSAIGSITQFGA